MLTKTGTKRRRRRAILGPLLAVLVMVTGMALGAGTDWAVRADDGSAPAAPSGVTAIDGDSPGIVVVGWDAVAGAAYYRIGWVSVDDVAAALAEGREWLDAFAFADVANRGQAGHTISGLTPGRQYAFTVASASRRFGAGSWSEWAYLTPAGTAAACPTDGGGEFPPTPAPPPAPTATPAPTPSPTPRPIDTLTPADLPGLLPSVADVAALATETVADSPVIKSVVLTGVCTGSSELECAYENVPGETDFALDSDGFVAGYRRWMWGGGLLNVYSVAGSRAYFTLTWASLYDTPADAKARVEALKTYDRQTLNDEIDEFIQELQLPVLTVNLISVRDTDAPPLGDYAVAKEYTFAGSTAIIDGREIRFVQGRTAVRAIVAGVFKKTDIASTRALVEIIAQRIEPFMTDH